MFTTVILMESLIFAARHLTLLQSFSPFEGLINLCLLTLVIFILTRNTYPRVTQV